MKVLLQSDKNKPKIIAITEVKHKNKWNLLNSELNIEGYNLYNNDLTGNGRGVAIYVSDELYCNQLHVDSVYNDFVVLQLHYGVNEKLVIGNFYRSPNNSLESDEELYSLINSICNNFNCKKIFVGDFNFSHINWAPVPSVTNSCSTCNKFVDIMQKNFLSQHVQSATRARGMDTPHLLDLVITETPDIIEDIDTTSPLGKSDHAVLKIKCKLDSPKADNYTNKLNYRRGDYDKLRKSLDIDWVHMFDNCDNDVDCMWGCLKNTLHLNIQKYIPTVSNFHRWKKASWKCPLDEKIRRLIRKKSRLWNRYIETRNPQTHKEYKKVRNEVRKQTRLIERKEQCEVAKQCKANPKKFWKYVNSKSKLHTRIGDIKSVGSDGLPLLANDDKDKADLFGDYFAQVYTQEPKGEFSSLTQQYPTMPCEDVIFRDDIILDKLNNLKVNKSPGPDSLHPRILHEVRHQLITPLRLLFDTSYKTGILPCEWKVANTVPIYKKGTKTEVNNYRPVSLTNVICKVMESIIRDHVLKYFLVNDFFSNKQFGFLKGRSTVLQLLNIIDEWTLSLDLGGQIDCIYMDFEKAFDKVPHRRLISKLLSYGINSNIIAWILDFLDKRQFRVIVNDKFSSWHDVLSGIPQGSILGPLLFIIYINDLPDFCNNLCAKLYIYADDTKLFRHIRKSEDQDNLQSDINKVKEWANDWLLKLNVEKCCSMSFTANINNACTTKYYIGDGTVQHELKKLDSVSDLGVRFDCKLSFSEHINEKFNKAYSILGIIKRNFIYMDKDTFILLYKAMVRPHLEYANSVWCPYKKGDIEDIEKVQKRATKLVISLKHLPYIDRLQQLKLPTLKYRRLRGDMIEVFKIVHNYYDPGAVVKLNFHPFSATRGNRFKLQKFNCHYNIRKYSFGSRVVNVWNSLPDYVVEADSLNAFKNRLDKYWTNQEVVYDYKSDLTGTGGLPVCA